MGSMFHLVIHFKQFLNQPLTLLSSTVIWSKKQGEITGGGSEKMLMMKLSFISSLDTGKGRRINDSSFIYHSQKNLDSDKSNSSTTFVQYSHSQLLFAMKHKDKILKRCQTTRDVKSVSMQMINYFIYIILVNQRSGCDNFFWQLQ